MKQFLIAAFVDRGFPRQFTKDHWPQHVTFLCPFQTREDANQLGLRLEDVCARHQPFEVTGESREMFGQKKDVPVTELQASRAAQMLNAELRLAFQEVAAYREEDFQTYRPHVTDQGGREFPVGATIRIDWLSLIEKVPGKRYEVWRTVRLGS